LPISELAGNSKNSSHYAIRLLAVVRFFKPLGENFMATLIWHFRCLSLLLPSISQRSRSVFPHFPTCCYSVFGTNWLKPAQNAFHHHGKSFPAPLPRFCHKFRFCMQFFIPRISIPFPPSASNCIACCAALNINNFTLLHFWNRLWLTFAARPLSQKVVIIWGP